MISMRAIRLPDTLSELSFRQPVCLYAWPLRRRIFRAAQHIGPAAINRNMRRRLCAGHVEDVGPRLTLDYGLRWELYTPITERAKRTSGFLNYGQTQEFVDQSAARLQDQSGMAGAAGAG